MSGRSSTRKTIERMLDACGVEYELVTNKHHKFLIKHNGQKRLYVTSASPSDQRARLNCFTQLRRVLTEMGVDCSGMRAAEFR